MSTDEVDFDIDVSRDQQVWPAFHGGWAVRRAGTKKYFRVYRTKAEALRHATEIARRKSRSRASEAGEFFRLNMPFELGLDVGCRHFGTAWPPSVA